MSLKWREPKHPVRLFRSEFESFHGFVTTTTTMNDDNDNDNDDGGLHVGVTLACTFFTRPRCRGITRLLHGQ
jgi:hypothetical protein